MVPARCYADEVKHILSVRGIHICLLYKQSFVTLLFLLKDKR